MSRPRLGIVVTHPVQYQAPLYRALTARRSVEPLVFFLSTHGIDESFDPGFGRQVKYDVPLLDGYEYRFARNRSPKWAAGRPARKPAEKPAGRPWSAFNPSLPSLIRRSHVDVLLVHGYSQVSHWLAYAAAIRYGIPYLLSGDSRPDQAGSHGAKIIVKRALIGRLVRNAGACLAIGSENREFYRSYGAPESRIFFAPYSVDTDRFAAAGAEGRSSRISMLKSLGLEPELPLVLSAGKLQEWKRPVDVVKAMDQLEHPANLIVIGDGPLRPDIERLAARRQWMRTLGFVNQVEIARWYGVADLFVLPSSLERWGLAVNEAMAAGSVPIVSDKVGCAPDLVTSDVGWVYATGDIGALARAIEEGMQPGVLADRRLAAQRRSAEYGIGATAYGVEKAVTAVLER